MSPMRVPAAVPARAQRVLDEAGLRADAATLIGGRAALLGRQPGDRISAGGATRLLRGPDGWCALTLSRPDDLQAVPALLETDEVAADPWDAIARRAADVGVIAVAEQARLLGLPVGVLGETGPAPIAVRRSGSRATPGWCEPLVVDLSTMWAGPLCGRLLADTGATVVKVESRARPDGPRRGPREFFDWMNAGKLSYEADFTDPAGLRRLLAVADVVIESSRPAALARHGLSPADIPARPGRVWIRITGHGTDGARADWVAFGDDAAVSGGLVTGSVEDPQFCGDAIADPLTGIHAAAAVLAARNRGGGELLEISMAAVAAEYAHRRQGDDILCAAPPLIRASARELGADTEDVDRMVGDRSAAPC
ncbi:CoA transferase [Mycobacterium sp. EPG1]|nr:CoA transferase [Mycobacterium sp. EPG1]